MLSPTKPEKLRLVLLMIFAGIFFGKIISPSWGNILFLLGGMGILGAIIWRNIFIGLISALLFAGVYSSWRMNYQFSNDALPLYHGQEVTLEGVVTSFPDIREKKTLVYVESEHMTRPEEKNIRGKLLLHVPKENTVHYGDLLKITGKITSPRNFDVFDYHHVLPSLARKGKQTFPSLASFDYQEYLKRFGIQTLLEHPKQIVVLEPQTRGNWFFRKAEKRRNLLAQNLSSSLPEPHSLIAMGILLGVKNELPAWAQEDFKAAGLQHLLVVSGFNVAVVIFLVTFLLRHFGRRIVFIGSLLAVLFFVAMTGGEAPVVRAALMGSITGWAVAMGRQSEARNLVFLSAVLIGLWNPRIVLSDTGFWLSATATLGIILGTPLLEKWLSCIPKNFGFRTMLSVTIAAQLSVFPILALTFGTFPYAGFISNLIAEPIIPIGMGFSFLSSLFGALPEVFAKIISLPAFFLLEALLFIARFFGQIPPLLIPRFLGYAGLVIVLSFFLWGSFSRRIPEVIAKK